MAYKSLYNGIIFIEGEEDYIENKGLIEYKKNPFTTSKLIGLDLVKDQLAMKVQQIGAKLLISSMDKKVLDDLNHVSIIMPVGLGMAKLL
ncbi:hypothetical protein JN00_0540 [Metamycoplasma subdolum]|uniref:Uncharacterized protein n=1 Tax=Metamycoplasma subdolum TaxID=92407 RepID=A0A3L9ZYG7_9BACT|nr:hypothetical protein [Metamycoplasma subdolum]RMA77490.1 hypothetical protein JN00_0540 [Metamycoplasma subdolum]WPB50689.1 hypothetical protein R9C05_00860 [Metamycoplasma subdolum]